jgi:hypothetical protein
MINDRVEERRFSAAIGGKKMRALAPVGREAAEVTASRFICHHERSEGPLYFYVSQTSFFSLRITIEN